MTTTTTMTWTKTEARRIVRKAKTQLVADRKAGVPAWRLEAAAKTICEMMDRYGVN